MTNFHEIQGFPYIHTFVSYLFANKNKINRKEQLASSDEA